VACPPPAFWTWPAPFDAYDVVRFPQPDEETISSEWDASADEGDPGNFGSVGSAPEGFESELDVWMRLGDEFFSAGEFSRAEAAYRKAAGIAPESALAHMALGETLFALGCFDEAAVHTRKAVELDPSILAENFDHRSLYPDPELFDRQLAALRERADSSEYDAAAAFLAGYVLFFSRHAADATRYFERVESILAEDPVAESFLARIAEFPTSPR
jgi:tetratricopeptide (TPR) repeat protein